MFCSRSTTCEVVATTSQCVDSTSNRQVRARRVLEPKAAGRRYGDDGRVWSLGAEPARSQREEPFSVPRQAGAVNQSNQLKIVSSGKRKPENDHGDADDQRPDESVAALAHTRNATRSAATPPAMTRIRTRPSFDTAANIRDTSFIARFTTPPPPISSTCVDATTATAEGPTGTQRAVGRFGDLFVCKECMDEHRYIESSVGI